MNCELFPSKTSSYLENIEQRNFGRLDFVHYLHFSRQVIRCLVHAAAGGHGLRLQLVTIDAIAINGFLACNSRHLAHARAWIVIAACGTQYDNAINTYGFCHLVLIVCLSFTCVFFY